ncbi:MAG: formate--tetrahydrofolate ligase [candidate division WOR-3 bacterium]
MPESATGRQNTDLEIARSVHLRPIQEIAAQAGITDPDCILPQGNYKAKVSLRFLEQLHDQPEGRLILVTAITPTAYGEGKTTVSIGLSMALNRLGHKSIVALRQPSLGPVFGVKGGAAGGGYCQVLPMEDINLHFTGDIHAVTSAHNLLAALLDNHVHFGNELGVDENEILWRRCLDVNDRALRSTVVGLGGKTNGPVREDGFIITAASEIMAILGLSRSLEELRARLCQMLVAFTKDRRPVRAGDLGACGALAVLLREALKPNLVQTIEHTPAFIHTGPFANIAHGTSSIVATSLALKLADYVVTEAGFGSDLGAEKFVNIVARIAGWRIATAVLVATVRALKLHGGAPEKAPQSGTSEHLRKGLENLGRHIAILRRFALPVVVALNRFAEDRESDIEVVEGYCQYQSVPLAIVDAFARGSKGAVDLASEVVASAQSNLGSQQPLYDLAEPVEEKIHKVATGIYGAGRVIFTPRAERDLERIKALGLDSLPICMAKTPRSLTDDPTRYGAPTEFRIAISAINIAAGAGYLVPIAGDIMLMPGLGRAPNAFRLDLDSQGRITGLS